MSTNKDNKSARKDPLREHELSKKLVKNGKPVDYLTIKGYVGQSDSDDIVRLYLNKEFSSYVDIKKNDILHAEEISSEDLEFGGTCVWVNKDAELTKVTIESKKQQARFMQGEIAKAQLRAEYRATDLGRMVTTPESQCNCNTIPGRMERVAESEWNCASLFAPVCPSDFVPCTTEWHCEIVVTARGIECVPQTPGCPTVRICPSRRIFCTPKCPPIFDPEPDLISQLMRQMEKLKTKVNKLEEEK